MVSPARLLCVAVVLAACDGDRPAEAQRPAPPSTIPLPSAEARVAASATLDGSRRTALVDATARVAPSVVSLRVTVRQQVQMSSFDAFFFGTPREQTAQSFGTGFVVRDDGIIITNQHVVAGAEQIIVTLPDGTDVDARLLGEDPLTDIAVVKIDRTALPVAPLGRSADLMIGEWAIALGNPYSGLLGNSEPSVTSGVISATGRNILPTDANQTGRYYDMIQTDASINPGNSGGPLVNALGEVIGVNSSIFSNTGGSVGIGFAIPIERAVRVAEEIIANGNVRRPWVGLEVAGAERMSEWKSAGGVPVVQVVPEGPAAAAGLRTGDVLTRANGRTLRNYLDWEAVLLDLHVGDVVETEVLRGGQTMARRIVPADLPTVTAERVRLRGLDLVTLTPGVRAELGARSEVGAALLSVPPETGRLTGLRDNDVIVRIDFVEDRRIVQQPVRTAQDVARILDRIPRGASFRLWVERRGGYSYTDLTN
jgi:serine protease Do